MQKDETEKLTEALEDLDDHVELLLKHNTFWYVFSKGVVGAVGAAIGATLVVALIVFILQQLSIVPVFGDVFDTLLNVLQQNRM